MPASEPYLEHNLLDRVSRQSTLDVNYRQMMRREQALLARRLPLPGGDVVSIGAGLASRTPPVPVAAVPHPGGGRRPRRRWPA